MPLPPPGGQARRGARLGNATSRHDPGPLSTIPKKAPVGAASSRDRRAPSPDVGTACSRDHSPASRLQAAPTTGRRRLPEEKVRRFRNRLRGLRARWRAGTVTWPQVQQRVQAWIAHAAFAHTWRLRQSIFRGGAFDPARGPDRSPAPSGWCAGVPGTTTRGPSAPPIATGTTPGTATTTSVSACPARFQAGAGGSMDPPGAGKRPGPVMMRRGGGEAAVPTPPSVLAPRGAPGGGSYRRWPGDRGG
jgi:hypothetical protein